MAELGKHAQQVADLIREIDIAMFTTVGEGGNLVSRPLSTQQTQFDGERLWFMVESDSPKAQEVRRNPRVNVAYASKDRNTYVSVSGDARVVRDQAKIDELWSDAYTAFFPGGREDPDLALIEVHARSAEYWDGPSTWLGKAVTFIISRLTRNDTLMSENKIVKLRGRKTARTPAREAAKKRSGPKSPVARSGASGTSARKSATRGTSGTGSSGRSASKAASKTPGARKTSSRKTATKKAATKKGAAKKAGTKKTATARSAGSRPVAKKGSAQSTGRSSAGARRR